MPQKPGRKYQKKRKPVVDSKRKSLFLEEKALSLFLTAKGSGALRSGVLHFLYTKQKEQQVEKSHSVGGKNNSDDVSRKKLGAEHGGAEENGKQIHDQLGDVKFYENSGKRGSGRFFSFQEGEA